MKFYYTNAVSARHSLFIVTSGKIFFACTGERLEFRCTVEGNPFPKVNWKKGQWMQLDDGGRYEVKRNVETGVCSLAIKVR